MSSHKTMTNRRQLLNMMGLGASTLFLPSLMGDAKKAYAQADQKRLLVFYTPHGPVNQKWQMRPTGPSTDWTSKPDRDASFTINLGNHAEAMWSEILKPLYPHRNKLLVLEGMAMTSALLDVATNNHNAGTSHALTGAKMVYPGGFKQEGGGGGTSIDQVIADKIKHPERIRSLYYNTGSWSPVFIGKTELQGENTPYRAYEKLFPVSMSGNKMFDYLKTRRPNAQTVTAAEYKKVVERLSADDKVKLQNHYDLVADLERQMRFKADAAAKCSSRPAMNPGNSEFQDEQVAAFGSIITAAFACDMTRVATLALAQVGGKTAKERLNIHVDVHQDIAHAATPQNTEAYTKMAAYYALLAKSFGTILTQLDAVKVDGGKTLLDNTVCLWMCELANGPHDLHDIMAVVAGGGSTFSLGRYVKFAENNNAPRGSTKIGPAHSKLFVSIQKAMGINSDVFGIDNPLTKGDLPMLKV